MASDLDDKAKRVRSLLSSYYGTDAAEQGSKGGNGAPSYVSIDSKGFDADRYVASLLRGTRLDGLLSKHVEMAAEIKNLDSDMQMLVYENYNKFISATDTIRRMKDNVGGMEGQMDLLLSTVTSVRSKSDGVNANLSARRERIESLNGTRSLLRKVQFVFDLPKRLRKCLEHKAYAQAVQYYVGALPILNKYGDSSFQSCKDETEEVMEKVIRHMENLVVSDAADTDDRAEAVQLLEQLNQPVDQLQEDFLARHWKRLLHELQGITAPEAASADKPDEPETPRTSQLTANKNFIEDFTRTASTFRTLFPQAETQLTQKTQELYREYFGHVQGALQPAAGTPRAVDLVAAIKTLSEDTHKMHEVVPSAGLYQKAAEAARQSVVDHVASIFSSLEERILSSATASTSVSGAVPPSPAGKVEPAADLSSGLAIATDALLLGSLAVVRDVEELLDDGVELLANWKEEYVDLVQSKFQQLFQTLHDGFLSLGSGADEPSRAPPPSPGPSGGGSLTSGVMSTPGLVLLLARLCVAVETQGLPRVTEALAKKFAGGSANKDRPSFLPSEFARLFKAAGEKLLQQYVNLQIKKLTLLVRKSVETPNWLKAKEPRDVRMVADLLLQEVDSIQSDVRQLLEPGEKAAHRRTNSGSAAARSTPPSAEQRRMAPTQRSRSRILERDVAKLFRQKVELFTKIEYTQSSVLSAIVKICLKSFEEFVRLETFSRSGFQQIQLDTQYLRGPLREYMDDETVVDTLLDEVCAAAAERCLDPTPLEPSVIDRIVAAKRSKQAP